MRKKYLKKLLKLTSGLFFISLSLLFVWQLYATRPTSLHFLDKNGTAHTLILPVKDKEHLFRFMVMLFAEDNFAYTVLGSKPLSWVTYQNPLPFSNSRKFFEAFSYYNRTLRSGWKTWEKYSHLFPESRLWKEKPEKYPNSTSIILVNEEQFNSVINNNNKDFQNVLRREVVDGFQLLNETKNQSLMNGVLEGHQALMGITLGYGRDNSWEFFENCEKRAEKSAFQWVWKESEYPIVEELPTDQSTTNYYLQKYSCPSFAGIPDSEESKALKARYLLARQRVLDYYKDKDFLEATLSLLAGYRPKELKSL